MELSALDGDSFVMVLEPNYVDEGEGLNIEAVIFNSVNGSFGPIFDVAQNNIGRQTAQSSENITTLSNGQFIVSWSSENAPEDTSYVGVSARIFNSDGSAATDDFLVNQSTESSQYEKSVIQLSNGNILFVYTNYTDDFGYWAREFDQDGTAAGNEFEIDFASNNYTNVNEIQLIALPSGGYIVVTTADLGTDTQLIGRQYDDNHEAVSDFFQIADIH